MKTLFKAVVANFRSGGSHALVREIKKRTKSERLHYGLSRDLCQPFRNPSAKVSITVRPLHNDDIPILLDLDATQLSDRGPYVRMHRLDFIEAGFGTCYVGVTENEPCYMQWLIPAAYNTEIQKYFHGIFPVLKPDEALLEFAFTPERWQGKGIMPAAIALITEKAKDFGARRVITFVDSVNVPALKGCKKAGFMPYLTRIDKWRLFRRQCVFRNLPQGALYPFDTCELTPANHADVSVLRLRGKAG
jgi:GNAT superfamily N-acetyltransferase